MAVRLIDRGECQRALEQQAAICQPRELATHQLQSQTALYSRTCMQLLTSAATLRYKAQKKAGAETMRICLIDGA